MRRVWQFLKEVRAEFKKVSWPSWDDVTRSTLVVFVSVVIFTILIYLIDKGVAYILNEVLG